MAEEMIEAWIRQIREVAPLLDKPGHVEVTLYANNRKVRRHPTIVWHGGPVEFVAPQDVQTEN